MTSGRVLPKRACTERGGNSVPSAPSAPDAADGSAPSPSTKRPRRDWSWPTKNDNEAEADLPTREFPGLLAGAEDAVWRALSRVDPQLFDTGGKGKQLAVREGLKEIGLGWVATNTTSYRMVVGEWFDKAAKIYKDNDWTRPTDPVPELERLYDEEKDDVEWTPHDASELVLDGRAYTNRDGELEFDILALGGDSDDDDEAAFPEAVAERISASIERTGMAVIRRAISDPIEVRESDDGHGSIEALFSGETLVREAGGRDALNRRKPLRRSTGNGEAGVAIYRKGVEDRGSFYNGVERSRHVDRLQGAIVRSLGTGGGDGDETVAANRKALLLKYSAGGENYSHRDNNNDGYFDCQALLMLSGKDEYEGGRFYVAAREPRGEGDVAGGSRIVRKLCPRLGAGDLVIFRADGGGGYDHGMAAVTRGERVALGLLQP